MWSPNSSTAGPVQTKSTSAEVRPFRPPFHLFTPIHPALAALHPPRALGARGSARAKKWTESSRLETPSSTGESSEWEMLNASAASGLRTVDGLRVVDSWEFTWSDRSNDSNDEMNTCGRPKNKKIGVHTTSGGVWP